MSDSLNHARDRDAANPLAPLRNRFHRLPAGRIYLDGNSLGLLSIDAEAAVLRALDQWKTLGIDGWLEAEPDWFTLGERLGAMMAPLVGADADEVVVTGTTTVNLHSLVSTFYQPEGRRRRIVATALDFPSDMYALQSQIALHGGDPHRDLLIIPSSDGCTIDEADIIDAMSPDVALVLLPSVLYRSGQLFDIERLAAAGRERGIPVGFDCAHSAGAVPHRFSEWGVDFAFWCTYKYLNSGPGGVGALYIHRRHLHRTPGLTGWWGYLKEKQFDMLHTWEGARSAGAWQLSTTPVLAGASLLGSLQIFEEAGIEEIRRQSLDLSTYLIDLLMHSGLTELPYNFGIGTPLALERRGGHVAVEHDHAVQIARALKARGIVPDYRAPNVIRLAPVALYTTFEDVWRAVQALKEIIDAGEHLLHDSGRSLVA
ncbi:MAG: kynureninase [Thermomicrobiales bacterium]